MKGLRRRLKVLLLTHNLADVGGSYQRAFSLARQLAALGHTVHLMASRRVPGGGEVATPIDGLHVLEMPDWAPKRLRMGGLSPIDAVGRIRWVLRRRVDVIHAFDHRPAVSMPALLGRLRGSILVSDWADLWGPQGIGQERKGVGGKLLAAADGLWETQFRRHVDGVTPINSHLEARLARMGIPPDRRMILPPGANADVIRPLPKREMRWLQGIPEDARVVAFIGFADYDVEFLVPAVLEILGKDPEAHLVTAGGDLRVLPEAVERAGFQARLHVLGFVPYARLERVLACADAMLLPFTNRPVNQGRFPNKLGDYLAAGRPIVTHATGDMGAWIGRHGAGVVASEDPVEFADEVFRLLKDPGRCLRMGRNARRLAEGELSWATLAARVEDLYYRLIEVGREPGWLSRRRKRLQESRL